MISCVRSRACVCRKQEKQGRFKLSFYAHAADLAQLVSRIQRDLDQAAAPYSIIHSVDPFNGDGLIDLLPAGVSKAHALSWWTKHTGRSPEDIVFAGDSGNDLAALTAGYRAIVVGNADRELAEQVRTAHQKAGWKNRLYVASGRSDERCSGGLPQVRFGLRPKIWPCIFLRLDESTGCLTSRHPLAA